jgi:hypothetical protein
VAIAVWLLRRRARRRLLDFGASLILSGGLLVALFESLSNGRLIQQLRVFAFAGTQHSSLSDGLQRIYQLVLRNQRSLPLLLLVAGVVLVIAFARRRVGLYELGLLVVIPILVVVMRDVGAYENHLVDLEVLSALVIAGLWERTDSRQTVRVGRLVVVLCLVLASAAAARYTLVPDVRAAVRHEIRGRPNPRYSRHPLTSVVSEGTCALFEDATIPLLAGQRPIVLDAFILHRLQTHDRPAIVALVQRIDRGEFTSIVLDVPLTDAGWFATLDFGTALADAMRVNYRPAPIAAASGFFVYRPRQPIARPGCRIASLGDWG